MVMPVSQRFRSNPWQHVFALPLRLDPADSHATSQPISQPARQPANQPHYCPTWCMPCVLANAFPLLSVWQRDHVCVPLASQLPPNVRLAWPCRLQPAPTCKPNAPHARTCPHLHPSPAPHASTPRQQPSPATHASNPRQQPTPAPHTSNPRTHLHPPHTPAPPAPPVPTYTPCCTPRRTHLHQRHLPKVAPFEEGFAVEVPLGHGEVHLGAPGALWVSVRFKVGGLGQGSSDPWVGGTAVTAAA